MEGLCHTFQEPLHPERQLARSSCLWFTPGNPRRHRARLLVKDHALARTSRAPPFTGWRPRRPGDGPGRAAPGEDGASPQLLPPCALARSASAGPAHAGGDLTQRRGADERMAMAARGRAGRLGLDQSPGTSPPVGTGGLTLSLTVRLTICRGRPLLLPVLLRNSAPGWRGNDGRSSPTGFEAASAACRVRGSFPAGQGCPSRTCLQVLWRPSPAPRPGSVEREALSA